MAIMDGFVLGVCRMAGIAKLTLFDGDWDKSGAFAFRLELTH